MWKAWFMLGSLNLWPTSRSQLVYYCIIFGPPPAIYWFLACSQRPTSKCSVISPVANLLVFLISITLPLSNVYYDLNCGQPLSLLQPDHGPTLKRSILTSLVVNIYWIVGTIMTSPMYKPTSAIFCDLTNIQPASRYLLWPQLWSTSIELYYNDLTYV